MPRADDAWSFAVTALRLGRGRVVRHGGARRRPARSLELWEFEACPFCRKVREGLSELDLDWVSRPTARGSNLRRQTPAWSGRRSYPHLLDPNTGVSMGESELILDYLHETYGAGRPHSARLTAPLSTLGSMVASALRPRGRRTRHGDRNQPPAPLELFQYEGCPYCRQVRERLHELNLVFQVRNVGIGSRSRDALRRLGGKVQVPFLRDPNTEVGMYESEDIRRYLSDLYG